MPYIVLYTTHCPRCTVLEKKLQQKGLEYSVEENIEVMNELGIKTVPMLQVDCGPLMDFVTANNWINSWGAKNG